MGVLPPGVSACHSNVIRIICHVVISYLGRKHFRLCITVENVLEGTTTSSEAYQICSVLTYLR